MNNEIDKKTINSNLTVPFIAIICFMLILIGTTYAYYAGAQISQANNSSNVNLNIPKACSFNTVTTGDCNLTNASTGTNPNDSIISSEEMTNTYDGNVVAQATCGLNVIVNGGSGCTCNYTLSLKQLSGTDTYTPTSASKEYTAQITSTGSNPQSISEANISLISVPDTEKTLNSEQKINN